MSIIGAFPAVDLLQQVLDMPHGGKGGGAHRPSSGFTDLVDAQLTGQAAASVAAAPRQRVTELALKPKKDERRDRRERSEEEEEAEEQAKRQHSSGRSLWA